MAKEMGSAVGIVEKYMENELRNKCVTSDNVFIELESRITEYEVRSLINSHRYSKEPVSPASLKVFTDFLAARWDRISGTSADYESAPDSFANLLCVNLAHSIARSIYNKSKASESEAMGFCVMGTPVPTLSEEEKNQKLRQACAANISKLFSESNGLIDLMTGKLNKSDWPAFITCCDPESLKTLFLGPGFINDKGDVYVAITALAADPKFYSDDINKNMAKLYCLLEIYKRNRKIDRPYNGVLSAVLPDFMNRAKGINGARRSSQAGTLQQFITSDEADFDKFMLSKPDDLKSIYSWGSNMRELALKTKAIKTFIPTDIDNRPSAMAAGI